MKALYTVARDNNVVYRGGGCARHINTISLLVHVLSRRGEFILAFAAPRCNIRKNASEREERI